MSFTIEFWKESRVLAIHFNEQFVRLELSGLIHERCRFPELEFIFKHALRRKSLISPSLLLRVGPYTAKWVRLWNRFFEIASKSLLVYSPIIFFPLTPGRRPSTTWSDLGTVRSEFALMPRHAAITIVPWYVLGTLTITQTTFAKSQGYRASGCGASLHAEMPEKNLVVLVEAEKIAQLLNEPVESPASSYGLAVCTMLEVR